MLLFATVFGTPHRVAATLALCIWAFASHCAQAQSPASTASERRVALVVGNSAYRMGPLKNPGNDALAVAAALRRLGFEVVERQNVSREGFALGVREFGDRLKGATVGLFYFAGHGLQVRGRNFLVPVDADIAREDEVPYRSIDVNEVLDKMDSARTPINLVLLDACRNNPFARSFKLSQVGLAQMDAPSGTLIGFATSPGSVAQDGDGENGLYTSALLRHMSAAGLPIEQMLKRVRVDVARASNNGQVPWEASSLNRDFFFNPLPSAGTKPAALAADEMSMELAFWDAVKASSSPADYLAYLEQYPMGRFAALARLRAGRPASEERVAPPAVLATLGKPVRAESPEGLYSAIAEAGAVRFVDVSRRTVSEVLLDDTKRLVVHALLFSADGRWLAVSGSREGRGVQLLVSVSEARVVWEKAGVGLSFDTTQALAQLQLASGELELVSLVGAGVGSRP
jgi:uncharacterized caspase-like protein